MKPEHLGRYNEQVSEVAFRRLTGELQPSPGIKCDVIGCDAPAICMIGTLDGHPSCELHARGADHIWSIDGDA
jgi:hypothetical protein